MKYSCLMFSEGRKDKQVLTGLIDLEQFKYHTSKWVFTCDNASGSAPKVILAQCQKATLNKSYDLIICFIDLDKLKKDHPNNKWKGEQQKLEKEFSKFTIIWQIDCAEDEYKKVVGKKYLSKHKLNKLAKQDIKKFINSDFWKRIIKAIKNKEKDLQ